MPISKNVNKKKKLTIFKITGMISTDEFRELIFDFYKGPSPTNFVIMDYREAEGTGQQFSQEKIIQIADYLELTQKDHKKRLKGKTASVADKDVIYGISRIFDNYLNSGEREYRTFRTMDEAMKWIEED